MLSFEEAIQDATKARQVPGAVVVGNDATGASYYAKAFGVSSLKEGAHVKPLEVDSTFWLASATKLLASISALQCVERGQFTLDEDVTHLLPELKDIDILTGFEEGTETPILVKAKKTITLRHLLTHTSGLSYDVFNPLVARWRASQGQKVTLSGGTVIQRCTTPLIFEPGEGWEYSTGLDWAGEMVARANNMPFSDYIIKYIWSPLGLKNLTFHPEKRPDMLVRLPDMSERQGGRNALGTPLDVDGAIQYTADALWPTSGVPDDAGGAGGYTTAVDYQKVLQSLTVNDGKLLSTASLNELFRPQLSAPAQQKFEFLQTIKEIHDIHALGIPQSTKVGYGLAGVVLLEDVEGKRRKGSMNWSGMPNLFWWIDREAGLNGIYFSQLLPPADPRSIELFAEFEKSVYETMRSENGGK